VFKHPKDTALISTVHSKHSRNEDFKSFLKLVADMLNTEVIMDILVTRVVTLFQ